MSRVIQIIASGIVVSVPEDKTDHALSSLRRQLLPLKYMPFVVEMNAGLKIDKIGILKGYGPVRDPADHAYRR